MVANSATNEDARGSILLIDTDVDSTIYGIEMGTNSAIDGINIFYPNQYNDITTTQTAPLAYGATIYASSVSDVSIRNINCCNPYIGIYLDNCDRALVDGFQGYPLSVGVSMTESKGAVLSNIHLNSNVWPNNSNAKGFTSNMEVYVQNNGTAMQVSSCRFFSIRNLFAFGYEYGLHFQATDGADNENSGLVANFGFDQVLTGVENEKTDSDLGVVLVNGRIIPQLISNNSSLTQAKYGVHLVDTASDSPLFLTNISYFSDSFIDAVNIKQGVDPLLFWTGGQATGYTGYLCRNSNDSGSKSVYFANIRGFSGSDSNRSTGGAITSDLQPVSD